MGPAVLASGLAVSLVIDRSSSMSGAKLRSAVAAAAAFIDRLGPHDVFEVLTFNERVERPVRFGAASGDASAVTSSITADGQTALTVLPHTKGNSHASEG